jgi:serine O-acetyltransferase
MNIYKLYRLAHFLYKKKIPVLPKIIFAIQYFLFNSVVPYQCTIGRGTRFGYGGIAVVIHRRAVIGKDCRIGSGVTIGGTSNKYEVPILGDRVQVSTGAKVIGSVTIGNDVIIGANAVVLQDIPSNSVAVGVPARIIKTGVKLSDYRSDL